MKKISVMIVDDERMALDHLVNIYEWESNGFEIVATAFNGKQALKKYRQYAPQIVITDIKMPFMDGIELIRQIRRIDSHTKILLLTAYGEFEYAKLAIDQGVNDYLLKNEITGNLLSEKLSSIKQKIWLEGNAQDLVLHRAISDYFCGQTDSADAAPEDFLPNNVSRRILDGQFYYMILKEDLPLSFSENSRRKYTPLYERGIISVCASAAAEDSGPAILATGTLPDNEILLVLDLGKNISLLSVRATLYAFASLLQNRIRKNLDSSFSLFVYYNRLTLKQFHPLLRHLHERLNSKFFFGTGKIYDLEDPALIPRSTKTRADMDYFESLLSKGDLAVTDSAVDKLFGNLYMDYASLAHVSSSFFFWFSELYDVMPVSAGPSDPEFPYHEDLLDAEGLRKWVKGNLRFYLFEKEKKKKCTYSREVVRSTEYMQSNYKNPELKISMIANQVGLSAPRLSVVFKKETGQTINEYLTGLRMERAKELLASGNYKIYEIAEMVGYGSSQYFSHLFYTVTGVCPIDYKKGGTS